MALAAGTKLGPYEIVASLAAGGVGEVYRAKDTRLNRTVAIKVLPQALSTDANRLNRFQYEARILSTLNHPNVLAIYDVGEQNGVRYLVSELLEGQTLREKLADGVLSRRRVAEYSLETAKGLAAAHEKGVVHRDFKPENIFLTVDDHVKILDFGLAKQSGAEPGGEQSATIAGPTPTTPGTVMGTVGYMSPEQMRGSALDHRSDIFSFGAVLYEMASGKRAFRRDSSVETMTAILKEDVPVYDGDRGWVSVVDSTGRHRKLTDEFATAQSLAWSPSGKEVWFTAAHATTNLQLYAVNLSGRQRDVLSMPQRTRILDIGVEGRVLNFERGISHRDHRN